MQNILSKLIFSTVLFATPLAFTSAFSVTNRTIVEVNELQTLYLLTFEINYNNHGVTLNKSVKRGQTADDTHLIYAITNDSGLTVKSGVAAARLFATASSTNTDYQVTANQPDYFTLAVLHERTPSSTPSGLQIKSLPFTLTPTSGAAYANALHEHELTAFAVNKKQPSTKVVTQ